MLILHSAAAKMFAHISFFKGDYFIEWGCYGREFGVTRREYKTANHRQLSTFANVVLPKDFFDQVGRETLRLENQFNEAAGIADEDNAFPQIFYDEALSPRNFASRFSLDDINGVVELADISKGAIL